MRQLPTMFFALLLVSFSTGFGMDGSQPAFILCPQYPEEAKSHMDIFKIGNFNTAHNTQRKAAISYFEETPADFPNRIFWLRQCKAADQYIQFYDIAAFKLPESPQLTHIEDQMSNQEYDSTEEAESSLTDSAEMHSSSKQRSRRKKQSQKIAKKTGDKSKKLKAAVSKSTQTDKVQPAPTQNTSSTQKLVNAALWLRVTGNNYDKLVEFLNKYRTFIEIDIPHPTTRLTPLAHAAEQDDPEFCELLLTHGADPNATIIIKNSKQGTLRTTPFLWALKHGSTVAAKKILENTYTKVDVMICSTIRSFKSSQISDEHALCIVANPRSAPDHPYSKESTKEMIKLLLSQGATQFCGEIKFHNTEENSTRELVLNKHDKRLLPCILKGLKTISCKRDTITLTGTLAADSPEDAPAKTTQHSIKDPK